VVRRDSARLEWLQVEPRPNEPQLLARARQGDLDAFNLLVEHYQTAVYNLCLRVLGAPQAAEDAAQEAFIAAYRNLGGFRDGVFRSWLYRIASNACYDELRRRKSRPAVSLDEPRGDERHHVDPAAPSPPLEERAEQLEMHAALNRALAALPDDQRLAVVLCDVHRLDYQEIADVMRCSLGTVKSRINRGRLRLRALVAEHAGELLPDRFRHRGENR